MKSKNPCPDLPWLQRARELLPNSSLRDIVPLHGGFSNAQVFKIATDHQPVLARISSGIYGKDGFVVEMALQADMARHNLAPTLLGYDADLMLSLSHFVDDRGVLQSYRARPQATLRQLVQLAQRIHDIPPPSYCVHRDILAEIASMLASISSCLPDGSRLFFERITALSWPCDRVSLSHFDFHQHNLLFDGESFTAIDWEMAGIGHPHFDLAVLSNFLFFDRAFAHGLLALYLHAAPTHEERVVFDQLRAISYAFLSAINFFCAGPNPSHQPPIAALSCESMPKLWSEAARTGNTGLHLALANYFLDQAQRLFKPHLSS